MFLMRKRGKALSFVLPLKDCLSSPLSRMRNGGKVAVVRVYLLIFSLSFNHLEGERIAIGDTNPLFLTEEFVEKFSEVFFRDDWIMN